MAGPFKLQSVLNYRQRLEDQAQQVLARTLQHQVKLQEQIAQCRQQLDSCAAEVQRRQQEGLSIAELTMYEDQIRHLRQLQVRYHGQLKKLNDQIDRERAALLTAARERQVMEKLKEKQEAEYRRELDRKEREMLDEISLRPKGERS